MKLHVFGSSHGIPEPTRRCTSYLVEVGGKLYFIDMGTQIVTDLLRLGYRMEDVRLVACTHPHGDHMNGIFEFVDLSNWAFKEFDPTVILPTQSLIDAVTGWIGAIGDSVREGIRFRYTQPNTVIYEDELVRLTAFPNQHCFNSYSFLFEAEGKKIIFTGDLKSDVSDFPEDECCADPDLVVTERAHSTVYDFLPVFERIHPKKVLFSHISPMREGELYEFIRWGEHSYPVVAAHDGLMMEI